MAFNRQSLEALLPGTFSPEHQLPTFGRTPDAPDSFRPFTRRFTGTIWQHDYAAPNSAGKLPSGAGHGAVIAYIVEVALIRRGFTQKIG